MAEALIDFIVLEVLEDDEKHPTVWSKTWKWMKRRQEQGLYNNLVKESRLEDTKGYNEMMHMKYSSFEFLLANIERDREILPQWSWQKVDLNQLIQLNV